MIERLRRVLDGIGYELGGPEVLDVLWLAQAMDGGAARTDDAAPGPAAADDDDQARPEEPATGPGTEAPPATDPAAPAASARPEPDPVAPAEDTARRHSLFTADQTFPGAAVGTPAHAIRAPGPRALPGMHGLARALRPLRAHADHRHRTVADIEATVRLTAESGVLDVIDRPEQELRHTAVLLVDASASMRVWQPLVREVRRLLERGGVFRAVQVHRFDLREGRRPGTTPRTESPVVFLLTDGVDEAWRGHAAQRFLRAWERSGPLVVVPPLPRRLWRGTAFDAQPQLLVAGRRFATDGGLGVLDPLGGSPVAGLGDRLPVPVVPLSHAALSTWARLLTRPGVPQLVDTILVGTGEEQAAIPGSQGAGAPPVSAEERLERFRASFSPDAYRLAVRLSAIRPLSLPVIQLMRIATLPATTSAAVSEVLLGDILQPVARGESSADRLPAAVVGGAGEVLYDFRPGVRDLLASGLGTEQSMEVVEAVGRALEPYLGRMPDFAALLADPDGSARLSPGASAFAVLVSPVLDRLYGGTQAIEGGEVEQLPPAPLRFTVFGQELAWRGDEPVSMGSSDQRAALAVLLLRERRFVSDEGLVYEVRGGDEASLSDVRVMRDHVSRLRRILAPAGVIIDNHANGYRLRAEQFGAAVPLDLSDAERLHAEAKSAYASGDLVAARRLLGEALDGLDGTPLGAVPGARVEKERVRLAEWRLTLVESRIELDLELGAHAEVVPELGELTAAHPLRELLRAQLMSALYRSGRQAEALAVYADTRRLLAEELGVDPSPELSELQQHILTAQPPNLARTSRYAPLAAPLTRTVASWPPAEGLAFGVLGPLRAWRQAEALPTGSPQQRALLTALLLRDGRTAPAAELIDALWGDEPPPQALAALRTYASRLRKTLGAGMLLSESGGYALRPAPDALDLHVARDLAAQSERVRGLGDLPFARDLLTQSLGLWDGEALASVPGPYAATQRARLEEWRLELLETRLDMDLELGAHAEAVSELTALSAAHPLRERLRELLMLALYRSGRQAEALTVYADTRRLLADELGVAPRPELSRLQQRILVADDSLFAVPHAPPVRRPAEPPRRSMLPATVGDFTGRAAFVRELVDRLETTQAGAEGSVMAVSAVTGVGGIGKTTLAVHVAHQVRAHFPDGQLYCDLQGSGSGDAAPPEAVLGYLLRALGMPDSEIAATVEERSAQFRAALDGRRILVLLDNARDATQIRPLLPGTAGCAALVTSRVRMLDLAGAHLVDLDVMSPDEALRLFTRIVGEERVSAERDAALDVVGACGFLPLAIRIAASRLSARRTWTVSVLAAKLADERRRLDELQAGDLAVKATFELGYGQLEPAQARAFRLLGLADGPDLSLDAAAAVLDLPPHRTEDLLESLVDTSLMESAAPGRYRYHDLVRLYARVCAERDEPIEERDMALSRLLDFYLSTAADVYGIERPGDRLVDHLAPTAYAGLTFSSSQDALNWLYAEAGCLLACALQSSDEARLSRAVDLLWVAKDLSESGANSRQYGSAAIVLRDAADASGDHRTMGRAALVLAESELLLGRFDAAEEMADRAVREAAVSDDTAVVCRATNLRGVADTSQSRYAAAEAHFGRALEAFRADRDRTGEASVLSNLSRVRLARGNTSGALSLARRAVDVYDDLGLSVRGANARYAMGLALTEAGMYAEAREALNAAGDIFRDHRQRMWEGFTHFRLAEVELADERPSQAAAHAEQALGFIGISGGEWRRGSILTVLGRALNAVGQPDRARACWQEALRILEGRDAAESETVRGLLGDTAASTSPRSG